ncbi:hypothetical protein EU534_00615 [Candidatus Heimdallarchaeota archaeon]|nr:MAG: hypothetical protein EU534_00615 [Candidatus Heimdallarchaeota archaeon]
MVISLVPKAVAKEGYQFTHLGGTETCKSCKFISVCVNSLEIGSTYEIIKVREKEHSCLIDDGLMVVCDLKEMNDLLTVKFQKFLDDVVITRKPIDCIEDLCENYDYCVSEKYALISKVKVLKNKGKIHCPLKYDLVLIEGKKITQ